MKASDDLRQLAEDLIQEARQKGLDSPNAVMWVVKSLQAIRPGTGESQAFDLVWSLWRP
ncbi:hypothetical protein [Magnetospirillum sp. 15-1]|uniref:hypothetical protein n=1 Tax=Magnetospirillum sp. 15-1 TaxID=1979370 RepID=UPI001483B729|nr:hypothetical protein [Magnetospirillum sp. 15-1]